MSRPKVNVTLSEPRLISRSTGHHWFPHTMLKQGNGVIYLGFSAGADEPGNLDDMVYGLPHVLFVSRDQGWNWFLKAYQRMCHDPWPLGTLNDGTVLSWSGVYEKPSGELFGIGCRSDGEEVFGEPQETPIQIPPGLVKPMDPQRPGKTMVNMCFGPIAELPSGEVLCVPYGAFRGDEDSRVFILKSTDRGASWSYVSTVAPAQPEKFKGSPSETGIVCLPNGDVLCVMRTGHDSAMIQSRSSDGGQTWTEPLVLPTNGVAPKLLLLKSGILACSFGRLADDPSEGNAIMFSRDNGETWTERTIIAEGPSTGYTSMVEIAPGEILFAFDDLGFGWDRRNTILTVNVKVEA